VANRFDGKTVKLSIDHQVRNYALRIPLIEEVFADDYVILPRKLSNFICTAIPFNSQAICLTGPSSLSPFVPGKNLDDISHEHYTATMLQLQGSRDPDSIFNRWVQGEDSTMDGIRNIERRIKATTDGPISLGPLNIKPLGDELVITDVCSFVDSIKT